MSTDAAVVRERLDELAAISEEQGRLTRRFATPALARAASLVGEWMEAAGMTVRHDAVGNVVGRHDGPPEAPVLVIGSHLDTVPDAGRFDGPLGVLAGIAIVERLRARDARLRFAVEVVGFADEEGARFGTAYLGSAAYCGRFDPAWLDLEDADGVSMAHAIRSVGGDPDAISGAACDPAALCGYLELHIEQGPVLEAEGLAVGVVTAIVGQTRVRVSFTGKPGHAGCVPMTLRRDALAAAAEAVLAVEAAAREQDDLVATVGTLTVEPGASNVVPGKATVSVDVRHPDDAIRARAVAGIEHTLEAIALARGMTCAWTIVQDTAAVTTSSDLTTSLEESIAALGHPVRRLVSGAGHDAVVMAAVAPVAMLFVRCAGGISHSPDEAVSEEDVAVALDIVDGLLTRLDR